MARHVAVLHGKHGRKLQAEIVGSLAGRPASELAVFEFRDGTRWAHRAVSVDGEVVGCADALGCLLESLLSVADVAGHIVLADLGRPDVLPELALLWQAFPGGPARLEVLRGAWMAPHSLSATTPRKLPWRTTLTRPGMSLTEFSSTLCKLAPMAGGRTTRPCSMPGSLEIVYVGKLARHFGRNVVAGNRLSHDFVVRWIFERRLLVELQRKVLAADQLAIGHLLAASCAIAPCPARR